MAIITISRRSGSLGDELAAYISSKLGCELITRQYALDNFFGELSEGTVARLNESAKFFVGNIPGKEMTFRDKLVNEIRMKAASSENLVVLGLGGCVILKGYPKAVHVRVTADERTRVAAVAAAYGISNDDAREVVAISDRKHKKFVNTVFGEDLVSAELYDLVINTDRMSVEEAGACIVELARKHDLRSRMTESTVRSRTSDHQRRTIVFKNPTEEEFARILDMYNIEWMYEPKTFPVEWDAEGNVTSALSPDFFLPKFNLYLELTTMEQKYVTRKNRKVRLVRELYPGTNLQIVYKKDFADLVDRLRQFGNTGDEHDD
ncbi:MAG: cytidylate kinase family protein [Clostridiales bacterium]|nr:cytidylate kinase family protein [Clostridiales bacterium]